MLGGIEFEIRALKGTKEVKANQVAPPDGPFALARKD
jgi:hypothetical protein